MRNIVLNKKNILLVIILSSLTIRFGLFYTKWYDLRHGSALKYGATAIGFYNGEGLSTSSSEVERIGKVKNNFRGNYLEFYNAHDRHKFVEFLPGPAILLGLLWKMVPVYNFAPYIWFQIFLESFLIFLFYTVFRNSGKYVVLLATVLMIFNLPVIKRTLMMGYDFWPQFAILVTFVGVYYALVKNKSYLFFCHNIYGSLNMFFVIALFTPLIIISHV